MGQEGLVCAIGSTELHATFAHRHIFTGAAQPSLSCAVSLYDPSGTRLDVCAGADLVPLSDPGGTEWPGVAGTTDAAGRAEVRAVRQLLCPDRRLCARPRVAGPAVENQLGGVAEEPGAARPRPYGG